MEFYHSSTILFVNDKSEPVNVIDVDGINVSMRPVGDSLLEIKTPPYNHLQKFIEESMDEPSISHHTYISLQRDGSVKKLHSDRWFAESEFVKLDKSYVSDATTGQPFPLGTLETMRDEILADYGYSFPGSKKKRYYNKIWYKPRHDKISDFADQMTDIDKHNLAFLERMISPEDDSAVASVGN
jgi:hypothetical protein